MDYDLPIMDYVGLLAKREPEPTPNKVKPDFKKLLDELGKKTAFTPVVSFRERIPALDSIGGWQRTTWYRPLGTGKSTDYFWEKYHAAGKAIQEALAPYMAYQLGASFTTLTGHLPLVEETITHELGHLWHLTPEEQAQVDATDPRGLTNFMASLPHQRQVRSEREARATNYLVGRVLGRQCQWIGWDVPQGRMMPTDDAVLEQSATPETQAVAQRILVEVLKAQGPLAPVTVPHYDYQFNAETF